MTIIIIIICYKLYADYLQLIPKPNHIPRVYIVAAILWLQFMVYIISFSTINVVIVFIVYHLHEGYLQLYTWNNVSAVHSIVVTIYGTCDVTSHAECFVLSRKYFLKYVCSA
jgi:hypothetical protein